MAKICEICGKGPMVGSHVSHAHNVTKRRWLPNLQKVKVVTENGSVKRMRVCASCIRSGKIQKPASVR